MLLDFSAYGCFSDWSTWSTCDSDVTQKRTRECNNPSPSPDWIDANECYKLDKTTGFTESQTCSCSSCQGMIFYVFLMEKFLRSFLLDIIDPDIDHFFTKEVFISTLNYLISNMTQIKVIP